MRNKLVLLLPMLLISLASCKSSKKVDDTNKVHIVVLAGQSGARGKALVSDLDSEYKDSNEDVDIFADGLTMDKLSNIPTSINDKVTIDVLKPGFGDYPSEIGPELGIGKTLASRYQKINTDYKTVIVKYTASGSTFLNHWYSTSAIDDQNISNVLDLSQIRTTKNNKRTGPLTNNLYQLVDKAIETLTSYGYEPVIDGLAFVHGEQDAKFDENMSIYKESLKYFIKDFREYYDNEKLPVVITEALTNSAKYSNSLRDIQLAVSNEVNNVSFIKTNDLYTNSFEPWHFDASSNNVLGNRIAADIISNNDNRKIKEITNEVINLPYGVNVELPQYLKASFTNYYNGLVKVNEYKQSYNPNTLGEQNVTFNVKTIDGVVENTLKVNVANDIAYVDGKVEEYSSSKTNLLPHEKGSIYVKKSEKGLYFAGNINDNEIYTDGENWHEGDMGQKDNNDDFRIYLAEEDVSKKITVCLSSANLLRIYNNGVSLDDEDKVLVNNNLVYKKKINNYQSHVLTKGLVNDGKKSNGLSFELFLPFDELGITSSDNLKVCFNYNDISSINGVKTNSDNYLLKNDYVDKENNIENYFSINELI